MMFQQNGMPIHLHSRPIRRQIGKKTPWQPGCQALFSFPGQSDFSTNFGWNAHIYTYIYVYVYMYIYDYIMHIYI